MVARLLDAMALEDPAATAKYALERRRAGDKYWQKSRRFHSSVESWAKLAPEQAKAWLDSEGFPQKLRRDLISALIDGTSRSDPVYPSSHPLQSQTYYEVVLRDTLRRYSPGISSGACPGTVPGEMVVAPVANIASSPWRRAKCLTVSAAAFFQA